MGGGVGVVDVFFAKFLLFRADLFCPDGMRAIVTRRGGLRRRVRRSVMGRLPDRVRMRSISFSVIARRMGIRTAGGSRDVSVGFSLGSSSTLDLSRSTLAVADGSRRRSSRRCDLFFKAVSRGRLCSGTVRGSRTLLRSVDTRLRRAPIRILSRVRLNTGGVRRISSSDRLGRVRDGLLRSRGLVRSKRLILSSIRRLRSDSIIMAGLGAGRSFRIGRASNITSFTFTVPTNVTVAATIKGALVTTKTTVVINKKVTLDLSGVSAGDGAEGGGFGRFGILEIGDGLCSAKKISRGSTVTEVVLNTSM